MHAVVLAAGYATRLRPLTNSVAKPLLPLAGRPMLDYLADKVDEVAEVEALHVVTNSRFAADFEAWARSRRGGCRCASTTTAPPPTRTGSGRSAICAS